MKKKVFQDSLFVGFAIFAIFFGAGNLIFPPTIGLVSGSSWPLATLGLIATGIILPIISILAISNAGGTFESLSVHINPHFNKIFNVLVMIGVGTIISIPRTAATSFELGTKQLFPSIPMPVVIIAFFALTYYFSNDKSNVIDKVGKLLTPILLLILIIISFKGIISPIASPIDTGIEQPLSNALLEAYQMGDLLTGLLCATIFISSITSKGYTDDKSRRKITLYASLVAGAGLIIIYGGLLFIGASASSIFSPDIEKAPLLIELVDTLMGKLGTTGLSIAVILACLTTSIGLSASIGDFINNSTNNKISYRNGILFVCVVGTGFALLGLESIVQYAFPIFQAAYPVSIVLTALGLFTKYIPNDGSYKGAIYLTLFISVLETLGSFGVESKFIDSFLSMIPLNSQGFTWLIPAILGFIGGSIICSMNSKDVKEKI